MSSIEENKEFVRQWAELQSQHDVDSANEMYSRDMFSEHFTWEQNKGYEIMCLNAFPDIKYMVSDMVAEGEQVAFIINLTGTHTGGPYLGIETTGKKIDITATRIVRIVDNKFVEWKGNADFSGLVQQLGVKATWGEVIRAYRDSKQ